MLIICNWPNWFKVLQSERVCGVFPGWLEPHLPPSPVPHRWQSARGIFKITVSTSSSPVCQLHYGGNRPLGNSLSLLFMICTYLVLLFLQAAMPWLHGTLCYVSLSDDGHLPKTSSDSGVLFSLDSPRSPSSNACPPAHLLILNTGWISIIILHLDTHWKNILLLSFLPPLTSYGAATTVLFPFFPSPLRTLTDFSFFFQCLPPKPHTPTFHGNSVCSLTHVSPLRFCVLQTLYRPDFR